MALGAFASAADALGYAPIELPYLDLLQVSQSR